MQVLSNHLVRLNSTPAFICLHFWVWRPHLKLFHRSKCPPSYFFFLNNHVHSNVHHNKIEKICRQFLLIETRTGYLGMQTLFKRHVKRPITVQFVYTCCWGWVYYWTFRQINQCGQKIVQHNLYKWLYIWIHRTCELVSVINWNMYKK